MIVLARPTGKTAYLGVGPGAGGARLATRAYGPNDGERIVLLHGLGQTLEDWPQALIDRLVAARFRVLSLDNRDVGRSARLCSLGSPPLIRLLMGAAIGLRLAEPPYELADMAQDVLSALDAAGLDRVHLVGASMGGMIAQHIAINAPDRVSSLTCIMSSSGQAGLSGPRRDVGRAMRKQSTARSLEAAIDDARALRALLAGPMLPADCVELSERIERAVSYGWPAEGGPERQYAAIIADRGRTAALSTISVPTLVIHGEQDPLLPPDHGRDLAARIPNARLLLLQGFGHEITQTLAPIIADLIGDHVRASSNST